MSPFPHLDACNPCLQDLAFVIQNHEIGSSSLFQLSARTVAHHICYILRDAADSLWEGAIAERYKVSYTFCTLPVSTAPRICQRSYEAGDGDGRAFERSKTFREELRGKGKGIVTLQTRATPNQRLRSLFHNSTPLLHLFPLHLGMPSIDAIIKTGKFHAVGDEDAFLRIGMVKHRHDRRVDVVTVGDDGVVRRIWIGLCIQGSGSGDGGRGR